MHTQLRKVRLRCSWDPAQTAGHKPQQVLRETGLSQSCSAIFVWSVWREAMRKSMHSSRQICGRQTANSHDLEASWLQNLERYWIIQQRIYQPKYRMWMIWGSVWLTCGLEWNSASLTMPLTNDADVSIPAFEPEKDIFNIHCGTN